MVQLANIIQDRGRLDEAEDLYRRAYTTTENIYGPDHAETGDLLHALGDVLRAQGKLDESEILFKRALVIMEEEVC